jgi:hypothetical protein
MAYSTRFYVSFPSKDGHEYRVDFQRRGYTGAERRLTGAANPVTYELGTQRRDVPFLNESKLRVRVASEFTSDLREVLHPDPRSWKTVLSRDGSVIWSGFVTSEEFASDPFEAGNTVSVTAKDGLGLLQDKPYEYAVDNSPERRTFLKQVIDQLDFIGARFPLHTLMRWYPYRESSPLTGPVLEQLGINLQAWEDPESNNVTEHRHEVLTEIAAGLGLEVFQGFDGWYAVQPQELLSRDPLTTYDNAASRLGTQSPKTRNADAWNLVGSPRGGQTRHSNVSATHDFQPEPENLVRFGSFEPDDPSATPREWTDVKSYWDFPEGVTLDDGNKSESTLKDAPVSIMRRSFTMGGANEKDGYSLAFEFEGGPTTDRRYIAERQIKFVGAGYPMAIRVQATVWQAANLSQRYTPYLEMWVNGPNIQDSDFSPFCRTVAIPQKVPPGAEMKVNTFLDPSDFPDSYDLGQPLIPEGASIPVGRPVFGNILGHGETTREYRIGDEAIYMKFTGEFVTTFTDTDGNEIAETPNQIYIPTFVPNDANLGFGAARGWQFPVSDGGRSNIVYETYLPQADIDSLYLQFTPRSIGPLDDSPEEFGGALDNLQITFLLEDEVVKEFTFAAQTGQEGREMEGPSVKFGDGPQPRSHGAISFDDGSTTLEDDEFGWKTGEWDSDESPNDRTLAQHRARERLRTRTSGTEEQEPTFLLREGNDWTPDSLLEFTAADGDELTLWRRNVQWNIRSGELKVPSFDLYQDDDSGIYTTLSSVQ